MLFFIILVGNRNRKGTVEDSSWKVPETDKYLCRKKHLGDTEKLTAASGGIGLPVETFYESSSFVFKKYQISRWAAMKGGNFLEKLSFYTTLISKLFI